LPPPILLPRRLLNNKPLWRIEANHADQYADKLSEGQKRLLKTNPAL
jgi:hypothetical protein